MNKLNIENDEYPPLLRSIYDPPKSLYYIGNLGALNLPTLAVVGSRKMSTYAAASMRKVLTEVVRAGVVLVSGMAFGVDSLAHQICVELKMPTVAVLGGGIDRASMYPKKNIALSEKIIDCGGCVISEYPERSPALKHQFIARNRIIAGLSTATLIVEAAWKSGSLITANFALENNREVLAIPSPIGNANSEGVNQLIKDGAKMVTSSSDILELFGVEKLPVTNRRFSREEEILIELLKNSELDTNELIENSKMNFETIIPLITKLEIERVITKTIHGKFIKV